MAAGVGIDCHIVFSRKDWLPLAEQSLFSFLDFASGDQRQLKTLSIGLSCIIYITKANLFHK